MTDQETCINARELADLRTHLHEPFWWILTQPNSSSSPIMFHSDAAEALEQPTGKGQYPGAFYSSIANQF